MENNDGIFRRNYDFASTSSGSRASFYTASALSSDSVDNLDLLYRNCQRSLHDMPQNTESSDQDHACIISTFSATFNGSCNEENSSNTFINGECASSSSSANNISFVNSPSSARSASSRQSSVSNGTSPVASSNSNDVPTSITELREVVYAHYRFMLLKSLPYLSILLAKAAYDDCDYLIKFAVLCATFVYANNVVKTESTAQDLRSIQKILFALLIVVSCLCYSPYFFNDEKLHLKLILIPPPKHPKTVLDLLWMTCLTDFMLKLVTVTIKLVLTMIFKCFISSRQRERIYLFTEATSQFYRSLAPIQLWLYCFLESYEGTERIIGVFLCASYVIFKGGDLYFRFHYLVDGMLKLIKNALIGFPPTKEQLQNSGGRCTICQDKYESPVCLSCNHIFCETCICTWLDRELTCPLCRAVVLENVSWRDGSTSFFMQLY